jgi:hypothetical protein
MHVANWLDEMLLPDRLEVTVPLPKQFATFDPLA